MHRAIANSAIHVKSYRATYNVFNNKDFTMDGKVYADSRARCACDQRNFKLKINMGDYVVPFCTGCQSPPDKFRLTAYYPDANSKSGKTRTGPIRHDDMGRRITTPDIAVYMLRQIEKEIDQGIFNPDKYTSQTNREKFTIAYIGNQYCEHLDTRKSTGGSGEITDISARKSKGVINNHIIPNFGHLDIQNLDHRVIKKIYAQDIQTNKARVLEELKAIFKFASEELLHNFKMPALPKKPQKNLFDETEIPDIFALHKVADECDNEYAKAVFKICGLYLLRPSDVVTLKRSDIDYNSNIIRINSHQSGSEEIGGRKSDKRKKNLTTHTLPVTKEFINIITPLAGAYTPENTKGYLFVNQKGNSFLPTSSLTKIWKRAKIKAAKKYNDSTLLNITPYRAAKHAGVTKLVALGYADEKIMRITGISKEALKHYARLSAENVLDAVENLAEYRNEKPISLSAHRVQKTRTSCAQVDGHIATYNPSELQGL